jgi:hypothetical protein
MIVRVTGSQLDRIKRCEASAALPQVINASDDEHSDRDRGTAVHRFLERSSQVGRDVALAEVDEKWRGHCADIELLKLAQQMQLSHEVAVAYNWVTDTARILQPITPRAYDIDPTCEVATTIDVCGVGDRIVYVGDYKGPHAWLPEPEQSYQLGLGALAMARLHGCTRARVEYIRIRDDGSVRKFNADLDVFGLEDAAEKIAKLMGHVPRLRVLVEGGHVPDVVEGRWCRYCPAKQHCPAKTALIRHVMTDPQPVPYMLPLTPETAQRAYKLLRPAKDALAQIEAALYAYAKTTPIPLGTEEDGSLRFFGELRRPGNEELDGAIVHQVITQIYGGEVANKVVEMTATKKAITDAVRAALPTGEKITHAVEKVFEEVRERGGSKRAETVSTIEFSVDPEGATKARRRKAS